jgi:hypothetical protein
VSRGHVKLTGNALVAEVPDPCSGWIVGDSEKGSARIPCAVLIPSLDGKRPLLACGLLMQVSDLSRWNADWSSKWIAFRRGGPRHRFDTNRCDGGVARNTGLKGLPPDPQGLPLLDSSGHEQRVIR